MHELPEHLKDVVRFSLETGLRQNNALGWEWGQVNPDLRHAWVLGTPGKNRPSLRFH